MARKRNTIPARTSSRRSNLMAIAVSSVTVWFLYQNFDPTPVGADPDELVSTSTISIAPVVDAFPIEDSSITDSDTTDTDSGTNESSDIASDSALLAGANNRKSTLISLLLLEQGMKQLEAVSRYTATFHKHERINGEMLDPQVMKIKVRHEPFSVYMKWLVGDKGREVLYADGKYDGEMLVKLGGLKGRFLPALKLDPSGGRALSEARYPITKIGLMEMARELIAYRRRELDEPSRTRCTMYEDRKFNERDCYCFLVDFADAESSPLYRKSIIYIDRELSLPVKVINYTWAVDATDLNDAELDELTLIEDYAFTDIDMAQEIADAEFDRTYKKYRLRR